MVGGNYVIGVIYLVICVVELRGNRYTRGDVAWSLSAEIFDLISLPVTQQNLVEGGTQRRGSSFHQWKRESSSIKPGGSRANDFQATT